MMLWLIICGLAKSPRKAMLLSLCIPGGGQFYNEAYVKGIIIGSAEVALGYLSYQSHKENNEEKRNVYLFWFASLVAYSVADAWIDAHMYGFDKESKITPIIKPKGFYIQYHW